MKGPIDLNRMQIFKQVVTAGSFSKAATLLHQPKSRVSRNISALERELGVQLIYRTTRHFRLTEAGKELFAKSIGPLDQLNQVLENLSTEGDQISGLLRVTAPEDMAVAVLGDVCRAFTEIHPKVQIDLQCSPLTLDFVKDSIDVAIRAGKLRDSSLRQRKLGRVKIGLFLGPSLQAHFPNFKTIEALERLPYLEFSHGPRDRSRLKLTNGKIQKTLSLNTVFASNNFLVLKSLATQGLGFCVLPAFLVQEDLRKGNLVQVFEDWGTEEVPVQIVTPAQKEPAPRVRKFSDFVAQQLAPIFG